MDPTSLGLLVGSDEMRAVWSEAARRRTWRRIWLAVAEAQASAGLIPAAQVDDLRAHVDAIDLARAAEHEQAGTSELEAEQRVFASQCPVGAGALHRGLDAADLTENADIARQRAAMGLLLGRLRAVLLALASRIDATADLVILGYSGMQPAEPTTLGHRLAAGAQDLLGHFETLARTRVQLRGKGLRGAAGTGAPLAELLQGTGVTLDSLEASVMGAIGMETHAVVSKTYPRVQDFQLLSALAALAASLHRFATEIELMQSPWLSRIACEASDGQGEGPRASVEGSPAKAGQVRVLARLLASLPGGAWHDAADAPLEGSPDVSAGWRSAIPLAFLATEQMLILTEGILAGLEIDEASAAQAVEAEGPFVMAQRILTALVHAGADPQQVRERLQVHLHTAREAVRAGRPNPLLNQLTTDTTLLRYAQPSRLRELLDVHGFVGQAPDRARALARTVRQRLGAADSA